jgi:hypothetical protein
MDLVLEEEKRTNCANQFSVYGDDEYLKVVINRNADINLDVLKEIYRLVKKTGEIKPIIILLQPEMNIGKEARDYIHKMNTRFPFPPVAVIAQTFNESLLANFYKKFYKPQTPYKIFKRENEAFNWLKGFSEQ